MMHYLVSAMNKMRTAKYTIGQVVKHRLFSNLTRSVIFK